MYINMNARAHIFLKILIFATIYCQFAFLQTFD